MVRSAGLSLGGTAARRPPHRTPRHRVVYGHGRRCGEDAEGTGRGRVETSAHDGSRAKKGCKGRGGGTRRGLGEAERAGQRP